MPSTRPLVVVLVVALAGCAGGPALTAPTQPTETVSLNGDDIAAETATVCPGDTTDVTVVARNASSLTFFGWTRTDDVTVDWENATASPSFDYVYQSLPPAYAWSDRQSTVSMTFTVTVSENATPDTYSTQAYVWHDQEFDDNSTTDVTLTVRGETACA